MRRSPLAAGAGGVLIGVALCAALAGIAGPAPSAWPAAVALAAGCLLLGLGGLGYLEAAGARWLIAATAGCWGAAALIAAWLQLAERAGVGAFEVRAGDVVLGTSSGLAQLVGVGAALLILAWAWRPFGPEILVAVSAAVGIAAVAISGHAAAGPWLPITVGAHALAAAWWVGSLTALALSVRGRGGWARSLTVFSGYALIAAAVLTVTGLVSAVGVLGFGPEWWTTGYGRVVLAKAAVLAVLLGLGGWHRRRWVPAATRHRIAEDVSLRRAATSVAGLSVALGLAAGLAATSPIGG